MAQRCLLGGLRPGQSAVIRSVGGKAAFCLRLAEMGITPGTRVLLCRRAPLDDPVELIVRGYALSLRREDADRIEVERVQPQGRMGGYPWEALSANGKERG